MVPTRLFLHYLGQLKQLLLTVERFDARAGSARLHPTMFPLLQQARTAIGFTLRSTCPLAGREIVSFGTDHDSFASVHAQLDAAVIYLAAIPAEDFLAPVRPVATTAGFAGLALDSDEYFLMYTVPNFFFHYSMVYAIARQAGVPIGKADFDGFHQYPPGFSFESA